MLKERTNPNRLCARKLCGMICICAGIAIMFTKVIYFIVTEQTIPFDGRGQFLIGTGATLLGITSFDNVLNKKETN